MKIRQVVKWRHSLNGHRRERNSKLNGKVYEPWDKIQRRRPVQDDGDILQKITAKFLKNIILFK